MTRWWLDCWPYQESLPRHPEPVVEPDETPGLPGWVDESN